MRLPRRFYPAAWIALFALGGVVEVLALIDPGNMDTLTEHVRFILGIHWTLWLGGLAAAFWAIKHFFFEGGPQG